MVIPEEDLLRPKDPSIKDSDDWPTYTLRRVKCSSKDGSPASLLSAQTNNTLDVVGSLDTVDSEYVGNGAPRALTGSSYKANAQP